MMTFCVVCKSEIDAKRQMRGSHFCSNECHSEYRRQRRSLKAGKACRLCGRGMPKGRAGEAVRSAHRALPVEAGSQLNSRDLMCGTRETTCPHCIDRGEEYVSALPSGIRWGAK